MQKWHLARRRALRSNRNFVHYSTIVAAVLAIIAGVSGVFTVAFTRTAGGLPLWGWGFMIGIVALTATLLVLFGALLIGAFLVRREEEKKEDDSLRELISLGPERMWPSERASSPEQDDRDAR